MVHLNWAVAVALAEGPARGLTLLDELKVAQALESYSPYHAARADLLRRAGKIEQARGEYARAMELCHNTSERRFFSRRIAELA